MKNNSEGIYQDDTNLKIKVIFKNKNNLIANVNLSINTIDYGFITIKGFQIWISPVFNDRLQEKINIKPPSKPMYGKYFQQVFIENEKNWFELESRVYDEYLRVKQQSNNNEEVDPNDIPI